MLMQAYFDEAGHHSSTQSVVVAGLAGFEYQWDGFDESWREALDGHGLTAFHMTDFENRKKAFNGWTEDKKRQMLAELMAIIIGRRLVAVGTSVAVAMFQRARGEHAGESKFFENPYHMALQQTVQALGHSVGPDFRATAIQVVFADQKEFRARGQEYYAATAALMFRWYLWPHAHYVAAATSPRIQAADIVAYELRKACDDPPARRWPMRQLRQTSHHFLLKGQSGAKVFGVTRPHRTEYFVMQVPRTGKVDPLRKVGQFTP